MKANQRVIRFLKRKGVTMKELAEAVGISERTLRDRMAKELPDKVQFSLMAIAEIAAEERR